MQRTVCQDASRQHEILKADYWEHDLTMNHHDERGCLFIFMTDTGCSMQTIHWCHGLKCYVVISAFKRRFVTDAPLLKKNIRTEVFTVCCHYVSK